MNSKENKLVKYLSDKDNDGYAATVVIGIPRQKSNMSKIASLCCTVEMIAKDLHYRAKGEQFYGLHELADRVSEIGGKRDELLESYWLGENQSVPPLMGNIMDEALDLYAMAVKEGAFAETLPILNALSNVLGELVTMIEKAKVEDAMKSGTVAILDDISKSSLIARGLVGRTLAGESA